MGLSIGDNDTCYMSMAVDVYEAKTEMIQAGKKIFTMAIIIMSNVK